MHSLAEVQQCVLGAQSLCAYTARVLTLLCHTLSACLQGGDDPSLTPKQRLERRKEAERKRRDMELQIANINMQRERGVAAQRKAANIQGSNVFGLPGTAPSTTGRGETENDFTVTEVSPSAISATGRIQSATPGTPTGPALSSSPPAQQQPLQPQATMAGGGGNGFDASMVNMGTMNLGTMPNMGTMPAANGTLAQTALGGIAQQQRAQSPATGQQRAQSPATGTGTRGRTGAGAIGSPTRLAGSPKGNTDLANQTVYQAYENRPVGRPLTPPGMTTRGPGQLPAYNPAHDDSVLMGTVGMGGTMVNMGTVNLGGQTLAGTRANMGQRAMQSTAGRAISSQGTRECVSTVQPCMHTWRGHSYAHKHA